MPLETSRLSLRTLKQIRPLKEFTVLCLPFSTLSPINTIGLRSTAKPSLVFADVQIKFVGQPHLPLQEATHEETQLQICNDG
jgi:hypothetical protein